MPFSPWLRLFSISKQGPVQKKMWGPHLGRQILFFLEKLATFLGHRCRFYSFTRVFPIISGMQKVAAPLVGPLFVGAPVLCGGPCSVEHAEHA